MPAVIDAPTFVAHESIDTHHLLRERPQAHGASSGFWRTLAHRITTHLTPTPRERHAPVCRADRLFETPMDRMARECPSVSIYALALV